MKPLRSAGAAVQLSCLCWRLRPRAGGRPDDRARAEWVYSKIISEISSSPRSDLRVRMRLYLAMIFVVFVETNNQKELWKWCLQICLKTGKLPPLTSDPCMPLSMPSQCVPCYDVTQITVTFPFSKTSILGIPPKCFFFTFFFWTVIRKH